MCCHPCRTFQKISLRYISYRLCLGHCYRYANFSTHLLTPSVSVSLLLSTYFTFAMRPIKTAHRTQQTVHVCGTSNQFSCFYNYIHNNVMRIQHITVVGKFFILSCSSCVCVSFFSVFFFVDSFFPIWSDVWSERERVFYTVEFSYWAREIVHHTQSERVYSCMLKSKLSAIIKLWIARAQNKREEKKNENPNESKE